MKKIFAFVLLGLMTYGISACQQSTGQGIQKISVDEFEKKLTELKDFQLVDVRTPEEYQKGHLKNAMLINSGGSEFKNQVAALDKKKPVLVYCLSGGRSNSVAEILAKEGFTEVYDMQGGYLQWSGNGKAVEKSEAATKKEGITIKEFEEIIKKNQLVLVDYGARWCAPCKKMDPIITKIGSDMKDKLFVLKVDADDSDALAIEQKIEALPTLVLYKDQKIVWRSEGFKDEPAILEVLKQY